MKAEAEKILAESKGRIAAELEEHRSTINREEAAATERASEIVTAAQSQASELRGVAERDVAQVRHDAAQEAERIVGEAKDTVANQMAEADRKVGEAERKATEMGLLSSDALRSVDLEVQELLNEAVEQAEKGPLPAPEEVLTDVYVRYE